MQAAGRNPSTDFSGKFAQGMTLSLSLKLKSENRILYFRSSHSNPAYKLLKMMVSCPDDGQMVSLRF